MFYIFLKIFVLPIIKLIWVKDVKGLENVPKKGGVIIASNHESYFDFITLYSIIPGRIYFLAGEIFFKKKQWAWLMKLTEQIKVDRDAKDKSQPINQAIKHLKEGKVIGIFPEGTRPSDGKLQRAYNGVIKIAILAGVPIIPVGIKGTFEIISRHDRYPKFKKCQLFFGEPIYYDKYIRNVNKIDLLTNLTRSLMKKIGKLCDKEYNY